MIEILEKAGQTLKDLPELAIWILIGILLYKVIIVGSVFGLIKLFILKLHDYLTKPKELPVKKVFLDGYFITHDGTYEKFRSVIREMIHYNSKVSNRDNYLHRCDVEFIKQAIIEKRQRDQEKKNESK